MLKQRLLTAVILIPLVLLSIFYFPQTLFSVACGAVVLLAAWEWAELMGIEEYWMKACYLIILVCLYIFSQQIPFPWVLMLGVAWWIVAAIWLLIYPKGESLWRVKAIRAVIGIFMLLPCWVALVALQGDFTRLGPWYLLFMLFIVWSMDTGAYFCGRIWGKKPLAPRVSPKKTVEGLYGGLVLAFIVALGFILWFHLSWQHALLVIGVCLLTALVSGNW